MRNIIRLTNDFILANGINTLPLDIDDLGKICGSLGYRLFSYSEANELIAALGVNDLTKHEAFTHCSKTANIVFFDERLPTGMRNFVIAHEIGHIVLKHNYVGNIGFTRANNLQEKEAHTFAYQLLAPLCILHTLGVDTVKEIQSETLLDRRHAHAVKKLLHSYSGQPRDNEMITAYHVRRTGDRKEHPALLICMLIIILILAAIAIHQRFTISNLQTDIEEYEYISSLQHSAADLTKSSADESTVYITKDGYRYHKENCYHIKNSTVKAFTLSDAEAKGYSPCKDCY